MESTYAIVTTTRAKYFGKIEDDGEKRLILESAYEFQGEPGPQTIARNYLSGQLTGENKRLELSHTLVESTTAAPDEERMLRTLETLLPDAKQRALGHITIRALDELLANTETREQRREQR